MSQKESECLLNGLCSFHFKYKGYTFCLSEVLGRGCDIENLKRLEKEICEDEEGSFSQERVKVPLFECRRGPSARHSPYQPETRGTRHSAPFYPARWPRGGSREENG